MRRLLVSYDLRNERNYEPVYDYLGTFDHHRPLESAWLISTNLTPTDVRDALKDLVDGDDGVFVVDITDSDWSGYNTKAKVWIKAH